MHGLRTTLLLAVAGLSVTGVVAGPAAPQVNTASHTTTRSAVGLTPSGTVLRLFDLGDPGHPSRIGAITGLEGDTRLIGIDIRPSDGRLYGVGDQGGVYRINRATAAAVHVSQLTVALLGDHFGVDFNPAADRLRIISDQGQNLRHDLTPGGVTTPDGPLSYGVDQGVASGLTGAAYTNNDAAAETATTLFDIDAAKGMVVIQAPANNGSLSPTGALGIEPCDDVGFDIASRLSSGTTTANHGYLVAQPGCEGRHRLYAVDLLTGRAWEIGAFPARKRVADLAVLPG